jgi:hypothetical protein
VDELVLGTRRLLIFDASTSQSDRSAQRPGAVADFDGSRDNQSFSLSARRDIRMPYRRRLCHGRTPRFRSAAAHERRTGPIDRAGRSCGAVSSMASELALGR